jgi:hypothetical protein
MNQKAKAKELVDKMSSNIEEYGWKEMSKQCALIAVDEILNCLFEIDNSYYWWQEVKEEIELL